MESGPKSHKTKTALMIVLVAFLIFSVYYSISYDRLDMEIYQPVNLPYPIEFKGQVIKQTFTVKDPWHYSFILAFKHDKDDSEQRQKLNDLLGSEELDWSNQKITPGVIIPVRLTLIAHLNNQDQILNDQVYDDHKYYAVRSEYITKEIDRAKLNQGKYTVIVENLNAIKELSDIPVRFYVERTYLGK